MHGKWEWAIMWWNPTAQTLAVRDSSSFVPVTNLPRQLVTILLLVFSLFKLVTALSQCLCSESKNKNGDISEYPQQAEIFFNE